MWFPVEKCVYQVQSSVTYDSTPDPADLDLELGYSEPELCFSRSQVRDPVYALLDSGATHVLLPGHMLPKGARSFKVTVNLAIGKEKARCCRNDVYAEDRAHPLLPLGRLANLLDTKFIWENGEALVQCRDKGQLRTMTKFEIRNNMAYASQMQFVVLRRALWVQQAEPQTVFDWKFWERAAHDPQMTAYLNHGVKAKMCETTSCVNAVGAHYVASRAHIEQACDSLRSQGQSITACIGLSNGLVQPMEESSVHIVKSLLKDVNNTWSTMVMRTRPFSDDLFQSIYPNHQVLLSCKPHRPGCHQWRPVQTDITADIKELQPDVIVECYLETKYYHYARGHL